MQTTDDSNLLKRAEREAAEAVEAVRVARARSGWRPLERNTRCTKTEKDDMRNDGYQPTNNDPPS